MQPIAKAQATALVFGFTLAITNVAYAQGAGPADQRARASLPAAVGGNSGQDVELEGTLEVLYEDYTWGARARHFLHTGGTRLSLHFASDPPGLVTGHRVRARGVRVGDTLALESGRTSVQVLSSAALPNTFGEQRTLVLLVNFQDSPAQPYTLADAHSVVFTTTSEFDREASFQQTWLTGDVFGWFTIAMNSTACDATTLGILAEQAAVTAGVNLSLFSRRVYAFPQNACTWWGLGTVGGNPSKAWINGSFLNRVVAHEMGHNFGLYHAHSMDCGTTVLDAPCATSEYGDTLDMMGGSSTHFNAFMKERLGWLAYADSPTITTIQTDGTYWLEPFESVSGGGAKALKILKSTDPTTGARTWYYVELRQAIGFDSALSSNANVLNGVVLRTGSESSGDSSHLLDMTPETESWSDPALVAGRTFTDTNAGVTINTVSAGSTGAAVAVTVRPPAPMPALAVEVSTDRAAYTRNQTVSITARVSASTSPTAGASVTFRITKSNGSVVTATSTTNASGVATCTLRLVKKDPTGVYQVAVSASAGAASGSGSTSFTVK